MFTFKSLNFLFYKISRGIPLRTVLILPFIILIFAVVGLVGWLSFQNGQKAVVNLASQLQNEVTTHIRQHLETYLNKPHWVNQVTVDAFRIGQLDFSNWAGLEPHLWSQLQQFDTITHIAVVQSTGEYVGVTRTQTGAVQIETLDKMTPDSLQKWEVDNQGQRKILRETIPHFMPQELPWYKDAVAAHKPGWSANFSASKQILVAHYPFYDKQGNLLAVVSTEVKLADLCRFLKNVKLSQVGHTFLMDTTGFIVANSIPDSSISKKTEVNGAKSSELLTTMSQSTLQQIGNLATLEKPEKLFLETAGIRHFLQVTPFTDKHGLRWFIVVTVPETAFMGHIHAHKYFTMLVFLFTLAIAMGFGLLTSRWVIQPLLRLNLVAKDFTAGAKREEFEFEHAALFKLSESRFTAQELWELANSFLRMTKQLQTLFTSLEAKNEDLRYLNKLRDEFLANTSHELRTPLNGIIGIAESLYEGSTGTLSSDTLYNVGMVIASGRRLANLIDDILNFSKKDKKIELHIQAVKLRDLAQVVINLSQTLANKKRLQLVNSVPENFPPAAADGNRVQQILINLVGNAIKFTEKGWIDISAKVTETKDKTKSSRWLAITVADTGIGIPSDKTAKIFESFEQVEGYPSGQYSGGTGLGLAVSRQLVRLHNGNIWVESIVGEGSRFTFTLPIAEEMPNSSATIEVQTSHREPDSAPPPLPMINKDHQLSRPLSVSSVRWAQSRSTAIGPTTPPLTAELGLGTVAKISTSRLTPESNSLLTTTANNQGIFTILIVDDEPVNLHVLVNYLSLHHYAITQASSGPEALDMIDQGLMPDLILLDVMMPYMTGYEVTQKIREKWAASDLPILLLTAKNQEQDLVTGLEVGANDYLIKPVSKNELLARIKTHIHIKQLKAETLRLTLESERRLKQFMEAVPVGVFVTDKSGHPYYANQRAQELLGKGVMPEATNEQFAKIYQIYLASSSQLYPDEKIPALQALHGHSATVDDMEIRRHDKTIPIEIWGTPIFDEQGEITYAMVAFQDITERKRAEEERGNYLHLLEEKVEERTHKLRENERILADAQRMALLGSWVWDIKTGTVQRSAQDCRNFCIDPDQYTPTYEDFIAHIHPDDKGIMDAMVEKCIMEGQTAEVEFRVLWPGDQVRTMRSQAELEMDASGTPIRLKGFTQDITERKRMEVALQDQFQFMEDMLQAIPNPIFYTDGCGHYLGCNRAFEEFTGYHKTHIMGKTAFELWPSQHAKVFHEYDLVLLQQPGIQVYESKMPHADGTFRHIITTKATYTNAAGLVIGLVAVITDINERKRTEEALRLSQFSLDRSADGILWMRPDGRHLYVNDALCAALGYSREELLTMSICNIDPNISATTWERHWLEYKRHGFLTFESSYSRKGGQVFPVEITQNYLEYKGKEYLCAFIRDITERKQAEEKLQQAKQAAETALQQLRDTQQQLIEAAKMAELGNLVAGVAHEINTPIGIGVTAASRLDTLTRELTGLYDSNKMKRTDLEKYLKSATQGSDLILKNLSRAAELVQSFKQVAVDQTGDQQRTFVLKDYLHEILTSLRPELKRTKHQVTIVCTQDITLHSYPGVFYQVVTNMVMNSLIHGFREKPEGQMTITASLVSTEEVTGKVSTWLHLNYSDDGRGIPAEVLPRIFDPFFTTNRQGGGSGLGLHIVYNLVTHKLGGIIHCDSVVGEGTTFRMKIPVG